MYSMAGTNSEPVKLHLQPFMHQYIIDTAEPVEYTVKVAATTRRGAGPAASRTGDGYYIPVCCLAGTRTDEMCAYVLSVSDIKLHACVFSL